MRPILLRRHRGSNNGLSVEAQRPDVESDAERPTLSHRLRGPIHRVVDWGISVKAPRAARHDAVGEVVEPDVHRGAEAVHPDEDVLRARRRREGAQAGDVHVLPGDLDEQAALLLTRRAAGRAQLHAHVEGAARDGGDGHAGARHHPVGDGAGADVPRQDAQLDAEGGHRLHEPELVLVRARLGGVGGFAVQLHVYSSRLTSSRLSAKVNRVPSRLVPPSLSA